MKVTADATYTAVFTQNEKPASYYLKSLTVYFKDGGYVALEITVKHISNEPENIPSTGEMIANTLFIGGACVLLAAAGTAVVIKRRRKKEYA